MAPVSGRQPRVRRRGDSRELARGTRAQEHGGHEDGDDGALQREGDMTGTRVERQSTARARPERAIDVSSRQKVVFSVANHVTLLVLRLINTVVQRVWPKGAEDELILTAKPDAAIFC